MTSPAITKSPDNQKGDKKSPTHSAAGTEAGESPRAPSPTASASSAAPPLQSEPFSWFRIFKLADLMMKQGC